MQVIWHWAQNHQTRQSYVHYDISSGVSDGDAYAFQASFFRHPVIMCSDDLTVIQTSQAGLSVMCHRNMPRMEEEMERSDHDPGTDKAGAALDVNVASFSDPDSVPGLSHAVEHFLSVVARRKEGCRVFVRSRSSSPPIQEEKDYKNENEDDSADSAIIDARDATAAECAIAGVSLVKVHA